MVIVVNVSSWEKQLEGYETFIRELLLKLVSEQQEHHFYFLSDKPVTYLQELPSNTTTVVLSPAFKKLFLQKYWFDAKLPFWLRKIRADLFIALDGIASLTTQVPQCLLIQDLRYANEPAKYSKTVLAFYNRYLPRFLYKARTIVLPTAYLKKQVAIQYKVEEDKCRLLKYAAPERFCPLNYELKESVKAIYTGGQEYFLYKGLIHEDYNLVNLFKAFSFFKKRQQSSWKLVLAGAFKEGKNEFPKLLETYKYKEDVIVTGFLSDREEAEVVGSAYALISPSTAETPDPSVWEALQCDVPVMVAASATHKELLQDGAAFFDGNDPAAIAESIMRMYRYEDERRALIEKGRNVAGALSWEQATASLWQSMVLAANA